MATLFISEFDRLYTDGSGNHPPIAPLPPVAEQTRSISGTSAQSSAFGGRTRFVRLYTDTACFVKVGLNPTAITASSLPLAAGASEYFSVQPGDKIAAIT